MKNKHLHNRFILGLHGASGVGKDFLASVLNEANRNIERIAFANPLKQVASYLFDDPSKESLFYPSGTVKDVPSEALNNQTPRSILLQLSKFKDNINPDCLFNITKRDYQEIVEYAPNAPVVFTDCRYPHECEYIRELGGFIVNIIGKDDTPHDLIPSKTGTYVFVNDKENPKTSKHFLKYINTILKENL